MAIKLPTGENLSATLAAVNSLTANAIAAQHYTTHLLPARMLFKGLLLAYIDEQLQKDRPEDEAVAPAELEAFANTTVADIYGYLSAASRPTLTKWISSKATAPTSSTSQLRRLASAHLLSALQDESAARFGMMAVLDALCANVTNDFAPAAKDDPVDTALQVAGSILQAAA